MLFGFGRKTAMPARDNALPGRSQPVPTSSHHFVNNNALSPPYPDNSEIAMFGGGCFWGVEKQFWSLEGIFVTAVGYAAGFTPNPTYAEVCTGMTGHNEVVRVVYFPSRISYSALLRVFWECHDPTQGMRQGNDVGTQYRSGIYTYDEIQDQLAKQSYEIYRATLRQNGYGLLTTEIQSATEFYFAEPEHQQYLAKNPGGYCGHGGTGVCYVDRTDSAVA